MHRIRFLALFLGLLALSALAAPAVAKDEKPTRGMRYPSLSPDGTKVVFAYRGDIWVAPVDCTTCAQRLTIHEAQDTLPRVSPDGEWIAFSSQRGGAYDVYVIPITGGEPKQVTFHSGVEIVCDWSPDGKHLLIASNRDPSIYRLNLYEVPVAGGTPRAITTDGGRDGAYAPDGKSIVYVRGFNSIYWDNYRGSANYDIYTVPVEGGTPKRVTDTEGNERYPFFSDDGSEIYHVAEEKGVANFYAIKSDGTGERRRVTSYKGLDIHRPDLAWDWKTAVFERGGRLFQASLDQDDPKARSIDLSVQSDVRHSGVVIRDVTTGAEHLCVSRDGARIAFSAFGDIWLMPTGGGKARRITSGPDKDEWPRISPDGSRIAFQSDRSGNSDLWLVDVKSRKTTQLTKHKAGDFFHNWAPDGSKLVFCSERSGNRDIWTIDVATGDTTQLTRSREADDDPVYSPDGKFIAFDSGREGGAANHHVFLMTAEGKDVKRITRGTGFFQVPNFSPDGSLISYESVNPANGRPRGVFVVSRSGGNPMRIASDGLGAWWSQRGDHIYFSVGQDGGQEIYRVPAPTAIERREKVPFMGEIEVDLRNELADLFDEAWKQLKDGFYDDKMHGVNWGKMREKYRDLAIDAENKEEFQNVVMQMLAELNASHLGIYGGPSRTTGVKPKVRPTGNLGVSFDAAPGPHEGRVITRVFPNGPAAKARLRVGDEIVSLAKTRIQKDTNLDKLLAGTVDKEITIRYRPITADGVGAETAHSITPISDAKLRAMQYDRWVKGNTARVRKESKGRAAYIHLNAMDQRNLQAFTGRIAMLNRSRRVKGLIIDVRENGGGNIHQQLLQVLTARPFLKVKSRRVPRQSTQPALYWDKPVVVLINERSFSDAEVFPYAFQSLGLGKVIGVPTAGGVIGTNDITLSDGTRFRIPHVAYYGLDGTNLEGHGVKPDILVEETSEDRLKGNDPQLARAIEEVLADIRGEKPATTKPEPTKPEPTKPDAQPTEEPTTPSPRPEPPKPGAARAAGPLDPLADAQPGEWVRYEFRIPGAAEATILRLTLTEVGDNVRLMQEVESGPLPPVPLPEDMPNEPLLDSLTVLGKVLAHTEEEVELEGKAVPGVKATVETMGTTLDLHFSNAVPAWGLHRVQMGKAVLLRAIEWGRTAPEDAGATAEVRPPDAKPEPAKTVPTEDEPSKPASPNGQPGTDDEAAPADPLRDARVGEWIRWKQVLQGQETLTTLRVVEVSDGEVVLESRVQYGDTTMDGSRIKRRARERLRVPARATLGQETLEVNGQKVACVVLRRTDRAGVEHTRWISLDLPVNGVVRHERDGKVVRQVVAWGTTPEVATASQD